MMSFSIINFDIYYNILIFSPLAVFFIELNDELIVATSEGITRVLESEYSDYDFEINSVPNISALAIDSDHTIWAGSYGQGLFFLSGNDTFVQFQGFKEHKLPNQLNIQDIHLDHRQRLWLATYGEN